MKPNASASWIGGFKRGKGAITTESGALSQTRYFAKAYARRTATNPYELIAAANAACFSMALANELAGAGFCPHRINTTATITMEQLPADWTITVFNSTFWLRCPGQSRAIQRSCCRDLLLEMLNCLADPKKIQERVKETEKQSESLT
jgi:osmotically inducible protein OsmC